jgi:hypothetical protein
MPKKKKPGLYSFAIKDDSEESLTAKKPKEVDTESVEAILSSHGDKRVNNNTKVGGGDEKSRNGTGVGSITVTREVEVV